MIVALVLAATLVKEPTTGFEVTVPDSLPCVWMPAGSGLADAGCAELSAEQHSGLAATFVFATSADRTSFLSGGLIPSEGIGNASAKDIDLFVDNVAANLRMSPVKHGERSHELVEVGGVQAARFALEPSPPALHGFMIPVKRDIAVTLVAGNTQGIPPQFGQAALASIRVRDPQNVRAFGEERVRGPWRLAVLLGGTLLLAIGIRAVLRRLGGAAS